MCAAVRKRWARVHYPVLGVVLPAVVLVVVELVSDQGQDFGFLVLVCLALRELSLHLE